MKFIKFISAMIVLISLSACQTYWEAHPDLGASVNSAIQAQKLNPVAPDPPLDDKNDSIFPRA